MTPPQQNYGGDAATQTLAERISAPPRFRAAMRSSRSAALRNLAWMMVDKAIAVAVGLAVFGLVARWFGPVTSGHLAYALAVFQAALGLSLVCSASVLLPRIYRMRRGVRAAIANVFVVRMGASLIAVAIAALFAVIAIDDPQRLQLALVILIAVPLVEPFYTAIVYWQSRNDNRRPTISRAAGLLMRAAVVLTAIALRAPVWVIALAWVLEAAVSAGVQYASVRQLGHLRDYARRVSPLRSATYLRFGIRFLIGFWFASLFARLDRLVLGHVLPADEFGVYAAAMQIVDVWLQVSSLIGFAAGPAFLYNALAKVKTTWQLWRVGAGLAAIGLCGLLGAWLFGDYAIALLFGPRFAAGTPYLIAGTAFGVLLFVDQLVQMRVTAGNLPLALTIKWGTACLAAVVVQMATVKTLGAYAGPTGLAVGILAGWIGIWLANPMAAQSNRSRALNDTNGERA